MIETPFTKKVTTPKEDKTSTPTPIQTGEKNKLAQHVNSNDMTKMGIFAKIKFDSDLGKIARTQLTEVARNMVEAQKQEITHSLMLDLDTNKKLAFSQYMQNVGILNKELVKRSTEMESDLQDILISSIEDIHKKKTEWIARIDALKLSDEDHKEEIDRMKKWIDIAKQQVDGKVELLIKTHSESIAATLKLLKAASDDSESSLG